MGDYHVRFRGGLEVKLLWSTRQHTNGLIREYLPKHDDFRDVSVAKIKQIERMLNTRPRKVLGFLTPEERLFSCKGSFF
jgi:IS30 family transposase